MKKKIIALVSVMVLSVMMSFSVLAAPSPTANTSNGAGKTAESPKTGESDMLLYAIVGVVVLGGTAVVSKKKLAEQ